MKKIFIFGLLAFNSSTLFAGTRNFSCGGIYDGDGQDFPFVAIHSELQYLDSENNLSKELYAEDNKFRVLGHLEIRDSNEFLKITIEIKETGIIIYNNNSQIGFPKDGKFNFVNLVLQNFGLIEKSGKLLSPKSISFQCQTYGD